MSTKLAISDEFSLGSDGIFVRPDLINPANESINYSSSESSALVLANQKKMKMFKLSHLYLFLFFHLNSFASDFVISTGETKKLPLKGSTIWIEKKAIITGHIQGKHLTIKGKSIGSSYLKINDELYQFQVVKPQNYNLFIKIHNVLKNKVGLTLQYKNSKITVSGKLYKLTDWIEIAKLISSDEEYVFTAKLDEDLKLQAQDYFNRLFNDNGIPEQKIQITSFPLIRLNPADPHLKDYQELLRNYGFSIIKDKTSLSLEPVVKVQITVAEVNRGFAQNYGVDFSDSYKAELLPVPKINDLETKLHFLESSGQGKLLASPNIICRSGKEAEFLAGGEFPIKIRSKFANDVVWKKYGVLLKVRPRADSLGRMSLGIQSEVSSIDKSLSVDGIPAISTNKVSSYFDLTESRVIALSGLLTDIQSQGYRGFPFLSRLPIVGTLFSSKDFLNKRSELVIFVKPSIMKMDQNYNIKTSKNTHLGSL